MARVSTIKSWHVHQIFRRLITQSEELPSSLIKANGINWFSQVHNKTNLENLRLIRHFEGWNPLQTFFFTVVTITTDHARVFTIFHMILGIYVVISTSVKSFPNLLLLEWSHLPSYLVLKKDLCLINKKDCIDVY